MEDVTGSGWLRRTPRLWRRGLAFSLIVTIGLTSSAGLVSADDGFSDVDADHPFATEIAWAAEQGITTGFPDGTFRPASVVTRQAVVAFLHRLWLELGHEAGDSPDPGFSDVPSSHPFFEEIAWAAEQGITTGFPDGTFRPASVVTRQAVVAFLHRLWLELGHEAGDSPDPGFSDVPSSHPFFEEIAWAAELGITTGFVDGTFRPTNPVTRQAAVAFLYRMAVAATDLELVVNTPVDGVAANPGDGICEMTAGEGDCSLRAAIDETNARVPVITHTIVLAADPVLSIPGGYENMNATGDLDVWTWLVIEGEEHTIDAGGIDRALDHHSGVLTVRNTTITGGDAFPEGAPVGVDLGSAIMSRPGNTHLVLEGSTIRDNLGSLFGGIPLTVYAGRAEVRDTTVEDNATGGVYGNYLVMDNATVRNNASGGVQALNDLNLSSSTVRDNAWTGVTSRGATLVIDSTIAANGSAGLELNGFPTTATVTSSTINANGSRGVVVSNSSSLTLHNSTVSGNGAGSSLAGSGVLAYIGTTVDLRFVTLAANGGPSTLDVPSSSTIGGSIVDATTAACARPVSSMGGNVVSDGTCGLGDIGDQPSTDAELGLLGNHGGPTLTHSLSEDSPARDAVAVGLAGLCDGSIEVDQRGEPRPSGPACDAGSVEGGPGFDGPFTFVVDAAHDAPAADPASGLCDDGSGWCTLRAAVDVANARDAADTIVIEPGVHPVLTRAGADEHLNATGDLDIWRSVTILGDGATLDAGGLDRAIQVHSGTTRIEKLTVTGGSVVYPLVGGIVDGEQIGGGIRNDATLELVDSAVVGNRTRHDGGGLANTGTATVVSSTIADNDATFAPGEGSERWGRGGGIYNSGTLDLVQSTVALNQVLGDRHPSRLAFGGAGIYNEGQAEITASTLWMNMADIEGVGGAALVTRTGATTSVRGSLIGGGRATLCTGEGTVTSGGYNQVGDESCVLIATETSQAGDTQAPPALGALADHGGPTPTVLAFAGGAGVDAIPPGVEGLCDGTLATDQRGQARPSGVGCDIGAVEGHGGSPQVLNLVVDAGHDAPGAVPGDGICDDGTGACTLRAAIDEVNAVPVPALEHAITLDADVALSVHGRFDNRNRSGDLDVRSRVVVAGDGHTIDAATIDRVFDARDGQVTLEGLIVTGGKTAGHIPSQDMLAAGTAGAGVRAGAPVVVRDTEVIANTYASTVVGSAIGGGIWVGDTTVTVERSLLAANTGSAGANLVNAGGRVFVRNSTLAGGAVGYCCTWSLLVNNIDGEVTISGSTISTAGPDPDLHAIGGAGATAVLGSILLRGAHLPNLCVGTAITSGGYNLVGDGTCPALNAGTDQHGVDPQLGPLADNGGPTRTFLPAGASPVVDAIPVGTESLCDGWPPSDQRGIARPQGGGCDIGAVERSPAD